MPPKLTQEQIVDLVIKNSKEKRAGWNGNKDCRYAIQIEGKMYYGKTQSKLVRSILEGQKEKKEVVAQKPVEEDKPAKKSKEAAKRDQIFEQSVTSVCSAMFMAGFEPEVVKRAVKSFGINKKSICRPTKDQEKTAAKLTADQMNELKKAGALELAAA